MSSFTSSSLDDSSFLTYFLNNVLFLNLSFIVKFSIYYFFLTKNCSKEFTDFVSSDFRLWAIAAFNFCFIIFFTSRPFFAITFYTLICPLLSFPFIIEFIKITFNKFVFWFHTILTLLIFLWLFTNPKFFVTFFAIKSPFIFFPIIAFFNKLVLYIRVFWFHAFFTLI